MNTTSSTDRPACTTGDEPGAGAGIVVEVNGERIATIALADVTLLDVSVYGSLDQDPKARLRAGGGNYAEGKGSYLIWIDERALSPGDVVRVRLDAACEAGDRGKTIQELYPDAEPSTRADFSIDDARAAELRAQPRLHDDFLVRADTASGDTATAASDERNTDFAFGMLWDRRRDRARLRLDTYCLDDVLARTGGTPHLQTTLSLGESATFTLVR